MSATDIKDSKAREAAAKVLFPDYRIANGKGFRLKDIDPDAGASSGLKEQAEEQAARSTRKLSDLQEKLYAQGTWALLVIFQAMDAAGKDGTIKHVLSGVNPEGCEVTSFKQPSVEELNHDFLWRAAKRVPERGRIGIFNRSYYEEVLIVRVHPEILGGQKLPPQLVGKGIWDERFQDIRGFERHLARSGVAILKFFLHISKDEQKRRFMERLDRPEKNWKFSPADVAERQRWKEYMKAYEEMIQSTASAEAPWHVVPANQKWYTRLVVSSAIVEKLQSLDLAFPVVGKEKKRQLDEARKLLA